MLEPDWVAEDPEAHLLPHVRRLCAERGWELTRSDVADAVLEVDVVAPAATVRSPHEAAFSLLGTFAEASTHVVERSSDVGKDVELLVTTGMLEGDGVFAPHGHTVRISRAPRLSGRTRESRGTAGRRSGGTRAAARPATRGGWSCASR